MRPPRGGGRGGGFRGGRDSGFRGGRDGGRGGFRGRGGRGGGFRDEGPPEEVVGLFFLLLGCWESTGKFLVEELKLMGFVVLSFLIPLFCYTFFRKENEELICLFIRIGLFFCCGVTLRKVTVFGFWGIIGKWRKI
jgi:hypothetical protein